MDHRFFQTIIMLVLYLLVGSQNGFGQSNSKQLVDGRPKIDRSVEWPQLKGNSGFTGHSTDDRVKPPLKLVWSYRLDGDASGDAGAGVIVADNKVFVSVANSHSLVALNATDGSFCWEYRDNAIGQIGYLGHAPVPAYHQGQIVLWQRRNTSAITVLDADSGEVRWTKELSPLGKDLNRGGFPVAHGMIYYVEGGPAPVIGALAVHTGKQVWKTDLGKNAGEYIIGPTVAGGKVFVSTRANTRRGPKPDNFKGGITSLNAKTGEQIWYRKNIYSWSPMASDGKILACPMWSSPDEKLYLLDCDTGKTIWAKTQVANHYNPPITLTKDLILYQPWGPKLHALSRKTGEPQWIFHNKFTSAGCCTPAVSGQFAYLGTSVPIKTGDIESLRGFRLADTPSHLGKYGTVNAIDLTTGKSVWRFPTTNTVCGDPAIAYGRLYFASRDGRVYCCAPAKANETTTPEMVDRSPVASQSDIAALLDSSDASSGVSQTDWPMQGGNPQRVGVQNVTLHYPLKLAWKLNTEGRLLASAAIVQGTIYVGSESGQIMAVDAERGLKKWSFDTKYPVKCSPAVAGGIVYCGSDSGLFYALNSINGKLLWKFKTGGPVQASPAIVGDIVLFGANDHNFYALNRLNGKKLWNFRTTSFCIQAPPVIHGQRVYAASWADWVWCLNLKTGKPVWKSFIPASIEAIAWYRDQLWVRSPYYVVQLNPSNGKWQKIANASYGYGGLAFAHSQIYQSGVQGQYGTEGATAIAINGKTEPPPTQVAPTLKGVGILKPQSLSRASQLEAMATPLALKSGLCFATLDGEVQLTDFQGKQLWNYRLGNACHAPPVAADGLLVIGCDDGFLYAFREANASQ